MQGSGGFEAFLDSIDNYNRIRQFHLKRRHWRCQYQWWDLLPALIRHPLVHVAVGWREGGGYQEGVLGDGEIRARVFLDFYVTDIAGIRPYKRKPFTATNWYLQLIDNYQLGECSVFNLIFLIKYHLKRDLQLRSLTSAYQAQVVFSNSQFNQPIEKWDVSNVHIMNSMFRSSPFNQNISSWCVSNITSEPSNFSTNSPLIEENKPVWGTCPD